MASRGRHTPHGTQSEYQPRSPPVSLEYSFTAPGVQGWDGARTHSRQDMAEVTWQNPKHAPSDANSLLKGPELPSALTYQKGGAS
ncbi:hypothetical protein NDU88_008866 [Pleurodeles waltl]|uniref:Uncharacterized protein n=1 Tax=Pleurodeles waltl TaxID=8319 RepID=A0AAV7NA35_PLEWA|nr:hypothetical protein NDU88_008866 [Pleurodeles waltl]